jgi:hypothetical protein
MSALYMRDVKQGKARRVRKVRVIRTAMMQNAGETKEKSDQQCKGACGDHLALPVAVRKCARKRSHCSCCKEWISGVGDAAQSLIKIYPARVVVISS